MAKAIRGTIGASGNITIGFNGTDYTVAVTRGTNGIYDTPLPTALDTAMAAGGTATVSDGATSLTVAVPGPVVGGVGNVPPIYDGAATLPVIPGTPGNADGFMRTDYGAGNIEFLWPAPPTFGGSDLYELVLDGIIIFRAVANSHLENPIPNGDHAATLRVVRNDGSFGPEASITFTV